MYKKIISLLCASALALSCFSVSASANILFPYSYDQLEQHLYTQTHELYHMGEYIARYQTEHPDSTIFDGWLDWVSSEFNTFQETGEHGVHGGAGGHRVSDDVTKLFNYNEVMNYSDKFQGSQSDTEYLSYDGRIRVWCDAGNSGTYDYERKFYITVDGRNPIANNGYLFREVCFNVRYEDTSYHSDGCGWYVKGSILTSTYHYNRNTLKKRYIDLSPYFPTSSTQPYNFYNVVDNSGQSWRYDPINNYYVNKNDDNHIENFIDLDITQFPEDDFNDFIKELQQIQYDDAFQFMSIYDLLNKILENIPDAPSIDFDPSQIKVELNSYDYTSLLQAIQAAIISIANYMPTLPVHQDCVDIIELLKGILNNTTYSGGYNYRSELAAILSKLDVLIGLSSVDVGEELLKDLTKNELSELKAYTDLIITLVEILPTTALNTVILDLQSAFFTTSPPSDLTTEYNGNSIVFLSASTLSPFSSYISVGKILISCILLYVWLLRMRSKVSDIV